ncbi:hypothetical protein Tco_1425035, partial [Tanacetum coccineum]
MFIDVERTHKDLCISSFNTLLQNLVVLLLVDRIGDSPHIFPHFEEDLRRYAARGTVSMDMLREAIKKDVAMYCDENVKPQEMNKKDNQSAKPKKKPVSQLVSLSLKSISCLISATHLQRAEEFVATAGTTKSLDASESGEELGNQPMTADAEK